MSIHSKSSDTIRALGLMSGSSLDGLDLAFCEFTILAEGGFPQVTSWSMERSATIDYPKEWIDRLQAATQLSGLELIQLHNDYGRFTGHLASKFIQENALEPDLIASHGHTVFHYPERGFTLQIGDGAAIAAHTGLTVISDFRSQDIAAGGQGAPLAPLADALLLPDHDFYLNLGGIANITAKTARGFVAFDICGANQVLNALVAAMGLTFDDKGRIARSGKFLPQLAEQQQNLAFFSQPYPKSLDNNWVREHQTRSFLAFSAPIPDKLHTACRLIATQIARHINKIQSLEKITDASLDLLVSGGGAYNDFLLECISEAIPDITLKIPDPQIIAFKEAALIGLMGCLRLMGLPNCLASVTGAERDVCGGVIHQGRTGIKGSLQKRRLA